MGIYGRILENRRTIDEFTDKTTAVEGGKLKTSEGLVEISVPAGWVPLKNLNTEASLQAGNLRAEQYALIFFEADPEPDPGLISEYAKVYVGALSSSANVSSGQNVKVGGLPALLVEFRETVDGYPVAYQHFTICGRHGYYQIALWTLTSREQAAKTNFRTLVQSFREL